MAKVMLIIWFVIEGGLTLASRLLEKPYADVFFVLTVGLLLHMTFRAVIREAQGDSKMAALRDQFDGEMIRHLERQRKVLLDDFQRVTGDKFPLHAVDKEKQRVIDALEDHRRPKRMPFGIMAGAHRSRRFG